MAAATSIHCMRIPPKIVPCTLVSPGSTMLAVSTREAVGEKGVGAPFSIGGHAVTCDGSSVKRVDYQPLCRCHDDDFAHLAYSFGVPRLRRAAGGPPRRGPHV